MAFPWIDGLGYLASFVILVSLTMRSIVRLRVVNALGSALFVAFAILTRSLPTVAMNLGIVAIDLYYIFRVLRVEEEFRLINAERTSAYLSFFHETYRAELDALFGADAFEKASWFTYYVRNDEIAGVFAWTEDSPWVCRVMVDFVTPRYRDTKIGRYFFGKHVARFRELGYRRFGFRGVGEGHWKYLERIGFSREGDGVYVKDIG